MKCVGKSIKNMIYAQKRAETQVSHLKPGFPAEFYILKICQSHIISVSALTQKLHKTEKRLKTTPKHENDQKSSLAPKLFLIRGRNPTKINSNVLRPFYGHRIF